MSLFDQIESFAGQKLHEALGQTRFGGLDGLLQHLTRSGLGPEVSSWVNPQTPNQPVSPDQMHQAIGGGELEKIAASLGVPTQMASTVMAKVLPHAASQQGQGDGGGIH